MTEVNPPGLRIFRICNVKVLDDKESYLLQINACLQEVEGTHKVIQQLQGQLRKDQDETNNTGLQVGTKILPLKIRCLLALINEGKNNPARNLLKNISLPLYRLTFPEVPGSPRASPEEEMNLLKDATDIYREQYPDEDKNAAILGGQLLGLLSMCDFHDKKRMAADDEDFLETLEVTLAQLEKKMAVYREMANMQSLIDAANPDFRQM